MLTRSDELKVYGFNRNLYNAIEPVGISGSRGSMLDSPRITCSSPNPISPRLSVALATRMSIRDR